MAAARSVFSVPTCVAGGAARAGREWHYSLDAHPLAEVYREWLESFAPYWEESLGRLKRRVEEEKA